LDNTYLDATQTVHELTKTYGRLPQIPAQERPDPIALRKEIAATLEKAIRCRESTYAEATRLYEVAERHTHRLAIIKSKLQALPQPPSRDPTPVPVSPQAVRPPLNRSYDKPPRLHLHLDAARHGASSAARPRDRGRKPPAHIARGTYARSPSLSDGDSDVARPRNPKSRARTPGRVGTNVHSSIAGISTSNALARLSPPPADARPGSRFAPWFELTEYEMAVLRKQMKKNAIWRPSDTMIRRELDRKQRGHTFFEKERLRCEAAGEEMLDEPMAPATEHTVAIPRGPSPTASNNATVAPAQDTIIEMPDADTEVQPESDTNTRPDAEAATRGNPDANADSTPAPAPTQTPLSIEASRDSLKESTETVNTGMRLNQAKEAKKVRRESQRSQAMRDAQQLEDATRKIKEAAESLKELDFGAESVAAVTPIAQRKKMATRPSNKRKRDASPPTAETPTATTREPSLAASQDSGSKPPDRKRPRLPNLQPIEATANSLPPLAATPTVVVTPQDATPVAPSSVAPTPTLHSPAARSNTLASPVALSPGEASPVIQAPVVDDAVPLPLELEKTTTVQVPLAPAGPSTPKSILKLASKAPSRQATPALPSPTEIKKSPTIATPSLPTVTAASSRPRRESVAPKTATPPLPAAPVQPVQPVETAQPVQLAQRQKTFTPAPEPVTPPVHNTRPRSARGHVPTPKAQSEEPKLNDAGRPTRELRRHSIFSQSAVAALPRMSTRKKPPPKGDIALAEGGQKTVTNVKRARGSKNKQKKKGEEEPEPMEEAEDIDPDEDRYCLCDDVSWGEMISCDNNVSFHTFTLYSFITSLTLVCE
jgi:hypothetical protein